MSIYPDSSTSAAAVRRATTGTTGTSATHISGTKATRTAGTSATHTAGTKATRTSGTARHTATMPFHQPEQTLHPEQTHNPAPVHPHTSALDFEAQMELSDKTIHFYNRLSPYYDRGYRSYLRHTHDKFMEMLGDTHPEDRILDLSAGTGMLAERLIQERKPFAHLTINDPSLGMLNSAMTKLPSRSDLTYTQHKAEELPFGRGQFDIICSLNSFHYYTDQEAVLRNVSKLLSPGGRFLLLDWNLQGFFHIPNRIIKTFSPEYIDTKPVTYHEEMLPSHGFSIRRCETWTRRYWNFYRVDARKRLG